MIKDDRVIQMLTSTGSAVAVATYVLLKEYFTENLCLWVFHLGGQQLYSTWIHKGYNVSQWRF